MRISDPTTPAVGSQYVDGEPIWWPTPEESWDMAFVLTTKELDFGDAPDPTYPTLAASNGASHALVPGGPFMGPAVDPEPDGLPSLLADGDDLNNVDDEDGVTIHPLVARGEPANVDVDMSSSPSDGRLNAWVDFNADGDWDDVVGGVSEQVFTDLLLTSGSVHNLTDVVRGDARGHTYANTMCPVAEQVRELPG